MDKINITVFVTGAVLMGLEILAGRTLSPSYGDTVYLWGSVIGIVLLGLSIGYYFGGKLADKKPKKTTLSFILTIAGLWILSAPYTLKPIVQFFSVLPRPIAPLATVTAIFLIPTILQGMVSPYAIKLKAHNLGEIGKLSGKLYAIATVGSVIGTFTTTFVLILFIPNTATYFLFGTLLIILAAMLSLRLWPLAMLALLLTGYGFIPEKNRQKCWM